MTPGLAGSAAPAAAPAAVATNAAAPATDATALTPFLLELEALAVDGAALPAAEPSVPEAVPAAEGEDETSAIAGLLNLILALAPPPPPPPPATAAATVPEAALAARLPEEVAAPAAGRLAALVADALPTAVDALPPGAAAGAPPFADLLTRSVPAAAPPPSAPAAPPSSGWPPLALDQPQWSRELGERLIWSAEEGLAQATIELHPQELGPIRVRIEIQGDTASVALQATHAATRELLAVSLPQLRELLNAQGLQLGRSQVASTAPGSRDPRVADESASGSTLLRRRWRVGLVDDYV